METMEKTAEILNDLVMINNDRILGYEKAARQVEGKDVDLKAIFNNMANQSREYVSELSEKVRHFGDEPTNESTSSGKVYRAWMDVKNAFTNFERPSVLESCEFGEDAAQKAYKDALESDAEMPADVRQMIVDQKEKLRTSHDMIKSYRDANKAVS